MKQEILATYEAIQLQNPSFLCFSSHYFIVPLPIPNLTALKKLQDLYRIFAKHSI
jgi:hypothetical protein